MESADACGTSAGCEGGEMATEKSLLQKIREKELEMSVKIDEARVEADQNLALAKQKATALSRQSEEEGKRAAEEFVRQEMERIRTVTDLVKTRSDEAIRAAREKGERHLHSAVERIVTIVLAE